MTDRSNVMLVETEYGLAVLVILVVALHGLCVPFISLIKSTYSANDFHLKINSELLFNNEGKKVENVTGLLVSIPT